MQITFATHTTPYSRETFKTQIHASCLHTDYASFFVNYSMRMLQILMLFSAFCFSQELKVEGNLNVTGHIQNDSLLQVIQDLQNQITLLQSSVGFGL